MAQAVQVVIIGAGPAGLTAAYLLAKQGVSVCIIESDPEYVGGISRTVSYRGFHFDIGGHRFFSKSKQVEDFWTEILPDDLLQRSRTSRIFYRNKFFSYPLKASEALFNLGLIESILCVLSYIWARIFPNRQPKSFEDWTSNQFGTRLFKIFFKTYTEKVWGMSCKDISADWAAQRIKGLSLWTAIQNALFSKILHKKPNGIKTLLETFRYPSKGPGMLWQECADKIKRLGGTILMGSRGVEYQYDPMRKKWTVLYKKMNPAGLVTSLESIESIVADNVISSIPIQELIRNIKPTLSSQVQKSGNSLKYRDFLTVMLILKDKNLFSDNWIYIHDPSVKVGRIQNFKAWSDQMVPDPSLCSYGLEYFCFEKDNLWNSSDEELIALAKKELQQIGLAQAAEVLDGCVVRQSKAYPVYDDQYTYHLKVVKEELQTKCPGLHLVGRNGMHKYNNQDHSMMTAMLTVENILAKKNIYDVWKVNEDAEYHESGSTINGASGLRSIPLQKAS